MRKEEEEVVEEEEEEEEETLGRAKYAVASEGRSNYQ